MPICEADPWREQYFSNVDCPEDVSVPTEDGDAYLWFSKYNWVYNKLRIAESQGLKCAPHGLAPTNFPVFSKPIYNMRGMGAGSRVLKDFSSYARFQKPGHMWMELCKGEHISTDVAVVNGVGKWWRHCKGIPLKGGMFDYWIVEDEERSDIVEYGNNWIRENLSGYSGMLNFETIGNRIIEVHLRFSDQWPDLYGDNWVQSLVKLYETKEWDFSDADRKTGYSVVLFGAHGVSFQHPSPDVVEAIKAEKKVTSVQITFHEDKEPALHSMPPGGFRLAVINGFDLDVLKKMRDKLALSFWSTQTLNTHKA